MRHRIRFGRCLALVALSLPSPAPARDAPPVPGGLQVDPAGAPVALPASAPIVLDGRLDDAAWREAVVIRGFRQREPREGADASLPTDVRVTYDARALYVAVHAFDPEPSAIVGLMTRRDTGSPSDWIRVLVDSYHDRRTAYEFAVNPAGVKQDRYWFNDTNVDEAWDAVWDVAVGRDGSGWIAEFRIPFSQLRLRHGGETRIGFAVVRHVARLNEISTWPLLPRSASGYVSSFGEIAGVSTGRAANRLELVPYVVSQVETEPDVGGNPLRRSPDPGAAAGLDFKYALTPGLTLTGTVNPDFGQVEADPAVVNLSAFETFFQERRPFFLEGSGIFRFDLDCEDDSCTGLFYSRRIGRSPRGELELRDGAHERRPGQTTILAASKVTGRLGAFAFGALNAITGEERALVAEPGGRRRSVAVEPASAYTVVRARREYANQSSFGFMLTSANRAVPRALETLPAQAYAGGFDADWRLSRRFRLDGYLAASRVQGSLAAIDALQTSARHLFQRPDADHLTLDPDATTMDGHAGRIAFSKIGGERVRFSSNLKWKSPGFEINEVGFLRRADERMITNWIQWRRERPGRILRSLRVNVNQWAAWNFGGDLLSNGGNVNWHLTFTNNWRYGTGVTVNGRTFDDRLSRGGPGGYREAKPALWAYVESDDRRLVSFEHFFFGMTDRTGLERWEMAPGATVRPTSALSVTAALLLARNIDPAQWVESETRDDVSRHVFGDLDQKTTAVTLRVNYTANPRLSLQIYARPFVSSGRYSGYSELADGRARRFEERFAPYEYGSTADFRYRSFRTTNVLRWEYRPGSALFVVWQQAREADGPLAFDRDVSSAFSAPARNVFLVKLAHWINP
jgi:hypothetical protein